MNAQEYRDALKKRTINKNNEANEENKGHKEPVKNAPVRQNQSAPQGEPRERMQRKPVKPVDREMAPQERMQRKPVKPVDRETVPQERMQRKPVKPVNKEAAPQERMQRKPVKPVDRETAPQERMQRKPVKPVDKEAAPQEGMQRKPVKPVNKEAAPQERVQKKSAKPVNKEKKQEENIQGKPVSKDSKKPILKKKVSSKEKPTEDLKQSEVALKNNTKNNIKNNEINNVKNNDKQSANANNQGAISQDETTKKTISIAIICVEAIILIIFICVIINLKNKISNKDFDLEAEGIETTIEDEAGETEASKDSEAVVADETGDEALEASEDSQDILLDDSNTEIADSVNVDNDNFSLTCSNVTVTLDDSGNPAALIYFSFMNKTDSPHAMSEIFPPSVTQGGEMCETFASMETYPDEFYNKDTEIQQGESINCCYAVSLKDAVTPIVLTIHDNYEKFVDIGREEIPIQ